MRTHARPTSTEKAGVHARRPAAGHLFRREAGPQAQPDRAASAAESSRFVHDFSRIPVSAGPHAPIQPRLAVNAPGDVYEREAERAAEQVLRAPGPRLHAAPGEPPELPAEPGDPAPLPLQTRRAAGETGEAEAPPVVHEVLSTPGEALDAAARGFMERRLGHDFSRVRVHADARAAESARAVNAEAYTSGQHVVFGAGRYAPGTPQGTRLLAHELAHTVQQGHAPAAVQRALKFEFQTGNHVWAVKKSGAPDPRLLPRKYAPGSVGYAEGAGEERGDKPAYLSVGSKGGPARAKGSVAFVEVEGPLVMKEAKSGVDASKDAQFVRVYQFKTQVKAADVTGKPVAAGQLSLVSETNHARDPAMAGRFNPNTFELRYLNADGAQLDLHLDEDRTFRAGHVKLMRTGRGDRPGIDRKKPAQHVEIWRVTPDPAGPLELGGSRFKVEKVSAVNHALDASMKGAFNPDTWEKKYFAAADFEGGKPKATATPMDVHVDEDGRLRTGRVKLMMKQTLAEAKEQTAIELQSETGGVLEFETPKWFREWPELQERVQEAVDITRAIDAQVGTASEVTDATVLDRIRDRMTSGSLGKVVEWPPSLSTAHLTNLQADKRKLLVQIIDPAWRAKIQASEGIALSEYGSLMKQHERPFVTAIVEPGVEGIFNTAFQAAKLKNPKLDESRFANLKGFLQLVVSYIVRGQTIDLTGAVTKAGFRLMARTSFASMYRNLLSGEEQALFRTLAGDPAKASDNPILSAIEKPINDERKRKGLADVTLNRSATFFFTKAGSSARTATLGPTVFSWLQSIPKGKDLLSGPGISDAMGAKSVQTKPGTKDYRHAQFEVRGTESHGGNVHPAARWVTFAKEIFDAAKARSADTPDDPSTPTVDETSRTGLRD